MENKPFKCYQESNSSLYFFHMFICLLMTQSPQNSGTLSKPTFHWLWDCCCLRVLIPIWEKQRKKEVTGRGGSCRKGRKELVVGGHTQPKPSQNLEKQGLISSPGKTSPYRGKVPENLRQLQEGREQGVRRPSQHSLRRDYNALIHEQTPRQYRASLTCIHTAHLLTPK